MSKRRKTRVFARADRPGQAGEKRGRPAVIGRRFLAIFGAGALLSGASLVQAIGNFGFHIVSTRMLGPAEYARLGALLNLVLLVGVPLVAIQLAATMAVARQREAGRGEDLRGLHRRLFAIAGAAVVGLVVAAPFIDEFFKIHEMRSTLLVAAFIGVSVVVAGWRGVAIGRGRDWAAALSFFAAPVLRLGIGVPLLLGGGGVVAAMVATVAAEAGAALILAGAARSQRGGVGVRLDLKAAGSSALMLTGLWLFSGVDVFVAVRVLDAAGAGEYLAIAALARTAMMIPQMLSAVGVRQWSARGVRKASELVEGAAQRTGEERGMTVERLVYLWLAVGVIGVAVFWASAGWWVRLLFGAENVTGSGPMAATLLVGGAVVAGVATITSFYFRARNSSWAQFPWLWSVLVLGALVATSAGGTASAESLAAARLVAMGVGAGLLVVAARRDERAWFDRKGDPLGDAEGFRVLHVIGEYVYEEGMGRTIDRVAGSLGEETHSDVLTAVVRSQGPSVREVIAVGGRPSLLMLRSRKLRQVARNYDLVHFHGGTFALLAAARMARHMPAVATVYGVATLPSAREWRQIGWNAMTSSNVLRARVVAASVVPDWVQRRAVKRVGVVLSHDQGWSRRMRGGLGSDTQLLEVLPGARSRLGMRASWQESSPEVIFIGRSERARGIAVLVKAFEVVRESRPDARLSLCLLETQEWADIQELSEGVAGVRVVSEALADPEARLASAQVGVWPYLAEYTTSPPALAPVEALAVGLPVIGTEVTCLTAVLAEGRVGAVVAPGEVEQLAEAIVGLLDDPAAWSAASEAALEHSRQFSWEAYVEVVKRAYEAASERRAQLAGEGAAGTVAYEGIAEVVS